MNIFKSSIFVILTLSFILITSCSTDNSITGIVNQSLDKPTEHTEYFTPPDPEPSDLDILVDKLGAALGIGNKLDHVCYIIYLYGLHIERTSGLEGYVPSFNINDSYSFKDDYLSKSNKGKNYTASYYLLSKYGIENNLVNKYYKEHYNLLKNSIGIAHELQHGTNNNQILIEEEYSENLRDMLKIYRKHPNHREIDSVLDYLEADLGKYQNKPKYKIVADFK